MTPPGAKPQLRVYLGLDPRDKTQSQSLQKTHAEKTAWTVRHSPLEQVDRYFLTCRPPIVIMVLDRAKRFSLMTDDQRVLLLF